MIHEGYEACYHTAWVYHASLSTLSPPLSKSANNTLTVPGTTMIFDAHGSRWLACALVWSQRRNDFAGVQERLLVRLLRLGMQHIRVSGLYKAPKYTVGCGTIGVANAT